MARFKPAAVFATAMILLSPSYTKVKGVGKKTFPTPKTAEEAGGLFFGSFKSYGGTERDVNGIYSVDDTAWIETWYRTDIKSDCRIHLPETGETFEVLGSPEDIELRHQYLRFKVRAFREGA